jgi:hypothetical protein
VGDTYPDKILVSTGQKAKWITNTLETSWYPQDTNAVKRPLYPQDREPSGPQMQSRDLCIHRIVGQVGHRCSKDIFVST